MAARSATYRPSICLSDHGHNGGTSACSGLCSLVSNDRHLMCSMLCWPVPHSPVTTALRGNWRRRCGMSGTAFLHWDVVQCRDCGTPLVTPRDTDLVLLCLLSLCYLFMIQSSIALWMQCQWAPPVGSQSLFVFVSNAGTQVEGKSESTVYSGSSLGFRIQAVQTYFRAVIFRTISLICEIV